MTRIPVPPQQKNDADCVEDVLHADINTAYNFHAVTVNNHLEAVKTAAHRRFRRTSHSYDDYDDDDLLDLYFDQTDHYYDSDYEIDSAKQLNKHNNIL